MNRIAALAMLLLAGCAEDNSEFLPVEGAHSIPMQHAQTFSVWERDGYRIVELKAPIVTWGGSSVGPDQRARIVLVPKEIEVPPLVGDLQNATVVRTPVQRIAVNMVPFEAMLRELGVADRLVAVGGLKSWDDDLRQRVRDGEIAQIGYGWHMPPTLDALVASQPDVFLMSLGDLDHAQHYERLLDLGIPVVPAFLDVEPSYMGDVDYVRLIGMLTGTEEKADAFVADVTARMDELIRVAATQPTRTVLSAWYEKNETWMVTVRNAEAAILRDANGRNVMAEPDDIHLDSFRRLSTEALLEQARDAECWIIRDTHSMPYPDPELIQRFRAWEEGCLFASDGVSKPEADAFDYYETAVIRPDWILGDVVRMLHPALRDEPFRYIRPDPDFAP